MLDKGKTMMVLSAVLITVSIVLIVISINILMSKRQHKENSSFRDGVYDLTTVYFNDSTDDIGKIISDTVITRDYIIKNTGTDSLHVLFVSPDCNCTGYRLSSESVSSLDSIILSMDIDMRNKLEGEFMLNTVVGLNTQKKLYRICLKGEVI